MYVNGKRVVDPMQIGPSDDIAIGDHRVRLLANREPWAGLSLIVRVGDERNRYELDRDEVTLGCRAGENDIAIFDHRISRKHFWFRRTNGTWVLSTHAGISNGTTLNGEHFQEPRALTAGDRIRIVNILIEIVEAS